jgi:membrane protein
VGRRVLVWYFARLSMVNVIYGSLATVVIVLLTLESAAVILLLGAQLVAQVERTRRARHESG